MDFESLQNAKAELETAWEKQVGTFSGFKVIENSLLPENEIRIVCGTKTYRAIINNRKKEDNNP